MLKFDHLALPVADLAASRAWYVDVLGMSVEFEMQDRGAVAVRDEFDFTIFLGQAARPPKPDGVALWFQVADVDATCAALVARGVGFVHPPEKKFWGYGAELKDPDGYLVRLWDQATMKTK